MGTAELSDIIKFIPQLVLHKQMWSLYDEDADVLYIEFKKNVQADNTEMQNENFIIRYLDNEVIGLTVLNAKNLN